MGWWVGGLRCGLWGLPTPPITYYLLPITYYLLPITYTHIIAPMGTASFWEEVQRAKDIAIRLRSA